MKKVIVILFVGIFLAATVCTVGAYHTHFGPSELIYYDASKSAGGYNLFSPFRGDRTYLTDMEGNVVNTWPWPEGFGIEKMATFNEDNGYLLRRIKIGGHRAPGETHYQELDWNRNILWDVEFNSPDEWHHHDYIKIFNAALGEYTYLSVIARRITHDQAIQAGADPTLDDDYASYPDGLVEFDRAGNVLWEWWVMDHLVQDVDATKDNFGVVADNPGKFDLNFADGRSGDWIHVNALDYNPKTGYIVFHCDTESEIWMIDHDGTFIVGDPAGSTAAAAGPGGDILWRWGNPAIYDAGEGQSATERDGPTDGDQQGFHVHDIQWIRDAHYPGGPALPGAGNLLQFDNGSRWISRAYHSRILEINPFVSGLDAEGNPIIGDVMVFQPDAGYHNDGGRNVSNQVVWRYQSIENNSFYARNISGMQRMPNGNTVVCSGTWGHFFEVTMEGEVVWEYKNPVGTRGILPVIEDGDNVAVFRLYRYLKGHPGLAGKDLVTFGTITGRVPLGATDEYQEPYTGFGFTGLGIGGGGVGSGGGVGGGGPGY
jgi:hypothetical protein